MILIVVILLYISSLISQSWCDREKDIINIQSNRQLELELTKLRQCIEEKAKMQQKSNDLQWEIETLKRKNNDFQSDNQKLNDKVTEYTSKHESALQEIQKLKVEIEQLTERHQNMQQAIHNHIGQAGPQIIAEHEAPMIAELDTQHNAEAQHPAPVLKLDEDAKDDSDDAIDLVDDILNEHGNDMQDVEQHQAAEDNKLASMAQFARNAVSMESAKIGIAVVIFCYNRASYLERTLESVFSVLPPASFSVFISQQGYDRDVTKVIEKYTVQSGKAYWLGFDYDLTEKRTQRGFEEKRWKVYHKISAHYKFVYEYLFDKLNYDKVIALEDDMEISGDFFTYFQTFGKLMDSDASIYCVSAWNDYGQRDRKSVV